MKKTHKWILAGLVLVVIVRVVMVRAGYNRTSSTGWDPVPGVRNLETDTKADLADFRAVYPYHIQTIALSKRDASGHRTLILSEPPPTITLDKIKGASPAYLGEASVVKNPIGHDGWAEDVVVNLSAPDGELEKLLTGLTDLMFHTHYKAYVLPLPAVRPLAERYDLNLNVTTSELRQWIVKDDEKFTALGGSNEVDYAAIASQTTPAVFLSKEKGLVAWWLPTKTQVHDCGGLIRKFALDSDLIIGAVAKPTGVLIVARERQIPVDVLPPLRFETVSILGSVKQDELAQSYERTHPYSGRMDRTNDWAPILLSPELRDTEYGSLLNIADQFLKGWSNAGQTKYEKFEYADPRQGFPFGNQALPDYLGVNQVTYNWNTTGAGYSVQDGENTFYALNRTGALPISYIPGETATSSNGNTVRAEQIAYKWYSNLNNPHIVRVLQYASLYQIFRRFPIAPATTPPPASTLPEETFTKLSNELMDKVAHSTPETLKEWLAHFPKGIPNNLYDSDEYRLAGLEALSKWVQGLSDDERDALKQWVANSRNIEQMIFQLKQSASAGGVDQTKLTLARNVIKIREQIGRYHQTLANIAAAEGLPSQYANAVAQASDGWIHTPAIVVSHNIGNLADAVGGHNLRAPITRFEIDPAIPVGHSSVGVDGVIKINPEDADRARGALENAARAAQDNRENPDAIPGAVRETVEASLKRDSSKPPRTMKAVFGGSGGKEPPSGNGRGFSIADEPDYGGPRPIARPPDGTPKDSPERYISIQRHAPNMYAIETKGYSVNTTSDVHYSHEDTADIIAHALASHLDSPDLLQIEMKDFKEQEVDALCETLRSRYAQDPEDIRGILRDSTIPADVINATLHAKCDFDKMTVKMIDEPGRTGVQDDGTQTILLEMSVPRQGDPTHPVEMFTKLVSSKSATGASFKSVGDQFQQMIGGVKGERTPLDATQLIRNKYHELRKKFPNQIERIKQDIRVQSKDNTLVTRNRPIEEIA